MKAQCGDSFLNVSIFIVKHNPVFLLYRHNSNTMIHIGLSLMTVALESGANHVGQFSSLMNLVKDDMAKNLFSVSVWLHYVDFHSKLSKFTLCFIALLANTMGFGLRMSPVDW